MACTRYSIYDVARNRHIIRPPVGSNERSSVLPVMYLLSFFLSFFRHAFSELSRPIALKLCHMVGMWPYFIIPLQKFGGGGAPPKKFGGQNMHKAQARPDVLPVRNGGSGWPNKRIPYATSTVRSINPKSCLQMTNEVNEPCTVFSGQLVLLP